jgi:hypothetical protein
MTHNDRAPVPERADQANHVTDVVGNRVGVNVIGDIRLTESSHIRRNGVEAAGGDCGKLMPPGVPAFRPPLQSRTSGPVPRSAMCMRIH